MQCISAAGHGDGGAAVRLSGVGVWEIKEEGWGAAVGWRPLGILPL